MSQSTKGKLNYRCPSCFIRDIDIDLFYDADQEEFYCLRCSFHGDENRVLQLNEQAKFRYGLINKRILSFNEDNDALEVEIYKGK
ncbi:MAG: hypothetical protein WCZ47_02075 [Bacilli bacterium]|jgi:hypothetical protein|nr:hypothetical protein [Bacilli bacterium]NLN80020.1 hypothetical protein [Erysipelotrichia bacterium]